ncbi:CDGSH iron-sulfur domain-containing protein 2 homolog isoform X1 [Nilaparvata lugens]|uniref:CDGSH iron-sulfur domain-containing protein 2 homolog isoform X1 n=1 Tax=Nilaparvata lugens TaxID=108931 RepID=UPI00193E6CB1|nr:CDGSH iron-sulfur domain-containing protein 2 homolog isoform X1 [Nilaparvata lugens]
MQPVNHIFTISIPNYLTGLPIPDHFTGWFRLGVKDWAKLIPFFTVVGGLSYSVYKTVEPYANPKARKGRCFHHKNMKQNDTAHPIVRRMSVCVYATNCGGRNGFLLFMLKQINPSIKKDEAKVVDCHSIEEIGDKAAFCRCWRSKKWPYCDGSHGPHNKETGDNVGPVVVSAKK